MPCWTHTLLLVAGSNWSIAASVRGMHELFTTRNNLDVDLSVGAILVLAVLVFLVETSLSLTSASRFLIRGVVLANMIDFGFVTGTDFLFCLRSSCSSDNANARVFPSVLLGFPRFLGCVSSSSSPSLLRALLSSSSSFVFSSSLSPLLS